MKLVKKILRLLPFLMLLLFAVYIQRHDLPESLSIEIGSELMPPEDNFLYNPQSITVENIVITAASQNTGIYTFTAASESFTIYFEPTTQTFEGRVPSSVGLNNGTDVQINVPFTIVKPTNNPSYALIYLEQPIFNTVTEPLEIIGLSFNNFLEMFVNIDIFNFDDFYVWTTENISSNYMVSWSFYIMCYELFLSLIFLMFDFINMVFDWANKFIKKGSDLD